VSSKSWIIAIVPFFTFVLYVCIIHIISISARLLVVVVIVPPCLPQVKQPLPLQLRTEDCYGDGDEEDRRDTVGTIMQ
jgi:hypothetical protein